MTAKSIKILVPTIVSLLAVAGLLMIEEFFHDYFFVPDSYSDTPVPFDFAFYLVLIIPVIFIACTFQAFVTLPLWTKFRHKEKSMVFRLWYFVILFSLLGGISFGLLFWSNKLSFADLIQTTFIGTILCAFYWTLNLLTLSFIDRTRNGT